MDTEYYLTCLRSLNTNKSGGRIAPHKPILLISLIDLYGMGLLIGSRIELDETFINEISNEYSFNNMRKEINNFLEKRKLLIEKKKSNKNFLLNKFTLLKKSNNVKIKIS